MRTGMPYNLAIPGQVSEFQLRAIEIVARLVPADGVVVEVGSLFGSSSWAWAKSVAPSATVFCIDPWEANVGVRPMELRHGVKYGLEQFQRYTADCPNIRPLRGRSPRDFQSWDQPVDLYYEDAVHTDPVLAQNLDLWSGRLRPTGIVCGDDYRPRFPDVRAGAARLASRLGRALITVDFFWCLLPEETALPGSAEAARLLRDLAAESDAARRVRGLRVVIGPTAPVEPLQRGAMVEVPCRVTNDSLDPWPSVPGAPLEASIRILAETNPSDVLLEARAELPVRSLLPDMPCPVAVRLETESLAPGRYRAVFDVVGPDGVWVNNPDPRRARGGVLTILPASG